jgi:hypothetical protein
MLADLSPSEQVRRCWMEWGHKEATQESSRRGTRKIGRLGPERGQKAGEPRKWPQGRPGQKPQEKTCRPAQCQTPTAGTPKEGLVAVAAIRSRFGYGAIGLGCGGIRYSAAVLR